MKRIAATLALLVAAGCSSPSPAHEPGSPAATKDGPVPVLVKTGCADLVVLGLRGSDQSLDKNFGSGQEILRTVRAMSTDLHRTSRTTVRLEGIPYRAESAASAAIYQANIEDGVSRTRTRIAQLARRCPHTRVALVGFSQGAQAVHGLAIELPASTLRRVALVAMIADPRRNPDDTIASWTYGKAAPGPGKLGAGTPLPGSLKEKAITFCATGDEICNWPPGGYSGPLSQTHRHFYETPAHSRSTGRQLAGILRTNGL
ncbi:cutinase family protein [Aeromicrobium sp. Root344]|uniref:cutinase family protein n=1 Tax=Aeromicrobium sp. Root344 TaxID=1736521 RepID=UPI0009E8B7F6|nr:cutinase family protein [Aeromicrobium sp. Root344]